MITYHLFLLPMNHLEVKGAIGTLFGVKLYILNCNKTVLYANPPK